MLLHDLVSKKSVPLHRDLFPGPVRKLCFAPDGRHLALGNGNGTVYLLRRPPR